MNAWEGALKAASIPVEPSHTATSDRGLLDSTGAATASEPQALTRSDGVHRD